MFLKGGNLSKVRTDLEKQEDRLHSDIWMMIQSVKNG